LNIITSSVLILAPIYLFASIPWGYVIGKYHGLDIRQHGSGNIGATNVNRVLGKKWGALCFLLDFLKGFLPVMLVLFLQKEYYYFAVSAPLCVPLAAFAAVAGHIWSIFLKFRGGKGIATIAGIVIALAPFSLLFTGLVWWLVFHFSRYVSVASITAAALLPASAWLFAVTGLYPVPGPVLAVLLIIALLAIGRHLGNIQRLFRGTEHRFVTLNPRSGRDNNRDKGP
jgi:glycerol-3-phosphate acyltransferase PlsY